LSLRSWALASLLAAAFACILTGAVLGRWEPIAMALPFVLYPYLALVLRPTQPWSLDGRIELETGQAMEGDEVAMTMFLENKGAPIALGSFDLPVPSGLELVKGRATMPFSLGRDEKLELHLKLRLKRRGFFEFRWIQVKVSDRSLLFGQAIDIWMPANIRVLPHVEDLKRANIEPTKVRLSSGNVPSRLLGPGSDFFGLRSYMPGDELRRINWKASARGIDLITNEFKTERSGDVVIVIDARYDVGGNDGRRMVDLQVDAAASLASHLLRQRNRVGMVYLGDTLQIVPLAYGRRQFYRLLEVLVRAEPGLPKSAEGIKWALNRHFSRGTMVVLVTPLEDRSAVTLAEELSKRRREMLVVAPDGTAERARLLREGPARDMAVRMSRLSREDRVAELRRYCQVVDWDVDGSLSRHLMGVRASHRRTA